MHHKVKKATPITPELLEEILPVVNINNDKEFVAWVAALSGYHGALRKSNLVPLKRAHDTVQNISRRDVRYAKGVMVFCMDWSKTNQFQEHTDISPLVANKHSPICPVRWLLFMMDQIPASPDHNLFSFRSSAGIVPITYRDLMKFMRIWIKKIGKDPAKFSSHSLRRGASIEAHRRNVSDLDLKEMGHWKSDCYKEYVDIDVGSRIKTWYQFNNM